MTAVVIQLPAFATWLTVPIGVPASFGGVLVSITCLWRQAAPSDAARLRGDAEDPVDVEVRRDELLDELDLLDVRRVRLDEQVVDLRRDRVRVVGDERREEVGAADRLDDGLARPIAAGQDEADRGTGVAVVEAEGRLGRAGELIDRRRPRRCPSGAPS